MQQICLGIGVIAFFVVGGIVDYWQSARHHNKPLPKFLKDYFALFWLFLYSGLLPFIISFASSGFDFNVAKFYLGLMLIGMTVWDVVYSLLDKHKIVSDQKDYFYWGKYDYKLNANTILLWHLFRIIAGLLLTCSVRITK